MHSLLRGLPPEKKSHWPDHLPALVQMYNCTPHSTTGISPHFLLFGQDPRLPIDALLGIRRQEPDATGPVEWIRAHRARLLDAHRRATALQAEAAAARKERHDKAIVPLADLRTGDYVYVKNRTVQGRNKFQDIWGPVLHVVVRRPHMNSPVYEVRPVVGGAVKRLNRADLQLARPLQDEDDSGMEPQHTQESVNCDMDLPVRRTGRQTAGQPPERYGEYLAHC